MPPDPLRPPRIYIAGPYTAGDVAGNVRAAIDAGEQVARWGCTVYIPHLTHFWHLLHPHTWSFWMQQDLAWLGQCDAILRLPGASRGADQEVATAQDLAIPVFHDIAELHDWLFRNWLDTQPRGEDLAALTTGNVARFDGAAMRWLLQETHHV